MLIIQVMTFKMLINNYRQWFPFIKIIFAYFKKLLECTWFKISFNFQVWLGVSCCLIILLSCCVGKFALWMLPQLFAYALNFPIQKFLQAQRKVTVMLWISVIVLVLHIIVSWLLILKLGWGLTGAAITLNSSWWLIVILQLLYIFITKSDGAWSGFTWLAFADLFGFVKLSLASAVMLWYFLSLHIPIWLRVCLDNSFFKRKVLLKQKAKKQLLTCF